MSAETTLYMLIKYELTKVTSNFHGGTVEAPMSNRNGCLPQSRKVMSVTVERLLRFFHQKFGLLQMDAALKAVTNALSWWGYDT